VYTNNIADGTGSSIANIVLSGTTIGAHVNGTSVSSAGTLAAGSWYKISVVVYMSTDSKAATFDFYVNDEKKLTDAVVRTKALLNYFHIFTSDGGGELILDYFRVYYGQPQ
jgi:hypothetical protein